MLPCIACAEQAQIRKTTLASCMALWKALACSEFSQSNVICCSCIEALVGMCSTRLQLRESGIAFLCEEAGTFTANMCSKQVAQICVLVRGRRDYTTKRVLLIAGAQRSNAGVRRQSVCRHASCTGEKRQQMDD